jgi:opacity protein-like surface antigen
MKRTIFGVAALALMVSASAAQAQRPVSFGIALGASMPTGDAGEGLEMGYHAMGTLSFSPPALPVGIRIDGMFNQLSGKTVSTPLGDFEAGDVRILGLNANATFGMPMAASPISPYLIGGLGMYNFSSPDAEDDPSTSEDEAASETKMGFNIGVGTKFALAGFGTFAEIRYHMVTDAAVDENGKKSSFTFVPITFGITF